MNTNKWKGFIRFAAASIATAGIVGVARWGWPQAPMQAPPRLNR
jgi:hypothetical protein